MTDDNDIGGGERLEVAYLVAEARREFFSADSGFLHTLKRFTLTPGTTMAAVWRGEKQGLTSPLRFFLLSYTIYALAFISTGAMTIYWADVQQQFTEAQGAPGSASPFGNLGAIYLQHPFVSELGIVLMLFVATWPWFNSAKINVAERAALPLYWYGTFNLLQVPFVWAILLGYGRSFTLGVTALSFLYFTWAGYTLFEPRRWQSAGRGLGWFLTATLLWPMLIALITGIVMGIQAGMAARGAAP